MSEQEQLDDVGPPAGGTGAPRARGPLRRDVHLRVSATAAEVTPIRHAVLDSAEAHGIAAALRADIALAVTEACANVVTHAYRDATAPGPLTVEVYNDRREFVVVVSDRGPGIAPRADSPGIGMGLALIAGVAHRLEISNDDTGARLTMAFAGG